LNQFHQSLLACKIRLTINLYWLACTAGGRFLVGTDIVSKHRTWLSLADQESPPYVSAIVLYKRVLIFPLWITVRIYLISSVMKLTCHS